MNKALEFLIAEAETINPPAKDYDCTFMARRIKQLLQAEGKSAEVIRFGVLNQYGEPQCSFIPLKFPEKRWSYHDVCSSEGYIYDPFLGKEIIEIDRYSVEMFRVELPYHTETELKELFENARNRKLLL